MSPGSLEGSWLKSLSIETCGVGEVMRNELQLLPPKVCEMLRQTVPPVPNRWGG